MPRSLLLAMAVAGALPSQGALAQLPPTEKVPDTMEARLEGCTPCHGKQGGGVDNVRYPRLAGKPAQYLYNQLVAFREGRRKYAPMNYLLAYLPDPYLQKMAEYYAVARVPFEPPSPPKVSQEVLRRGQQLASHGDPDPKIPACMACHGPHLSGREPGIPGLIGLKAEYISTQLGAWRYGTRTAISPDCMQLIAARMTEADVAAVSAWLSSMPIPANTKPLPRSAERLPLACGSQKTP